MPWVRDAVEAGSKRERVLAVETIAFVRDAIGLLAAGLTGIWLFPPWWAPQAFGVRMPVVRMDSDHLAGNHFTMRCEYADEMLGQYRPGSLRVMRSAPVRAGDLFEKVGNSGNTVEPHLHIYAQRPGAAESPMSSDRLPIRLGGRFLLRNNLVVVP